MSSSPDELAGTNNIQTQMVFIKGKRTKRRGLSSSCGGIPVTSSSSSGGVFSSVLYQTIARDQIYNESATEEEMEVASCLILLSQGDSPMKIEKGCKMERSRRVRIKFKPTNNVHKNSPRPLNSNQTGNAMAGKMHECLMCGLEFASGQALGGHMRKHKCVVVSTTQVAVLGDDRDSSGIAETSTRIDMKKRNVLEFDLNLPAPEEDDQYHATTQQPIIVFSAPALVDYHY